MSSDAAELAPAPLFVIDSHRRITWVNAAFAELVDRPVAECVGLAMHELASDEDRIPLDRAFAADASFDISFRVRRRPTPRWVTARVRFGADGRGFGTLHEIDRARSARSALEWMLFDAESVTNVRTAFLAKLSHEVRTPMNAVIGMTDLLADSKLDREQARQIEILQSAGNELLQVIDDVFELSKVQKQRRALDAGLLDLRAIAEAALDEVAERAALKHTQIRLELDATLPSHLLGESVLLVETLVALLDHVIGSLSNGGDLVLRIERDATATAGGVCFWLRDRAADPTHDRWSAAFADPARVGRPGSDSLLCQKLVSVLGGRIWVDRVGGGASRICIAVPLRRDGALSDSRCVLVARDLATLRELRQPLEERGATVDELKSEGALRSWVVSAPEGARPRLLIIDDSALDSDGVGLIAAVRARYSPEALGLIVVSDEAQRSDRPGAVVTLGRPFDRRQLFDAVILAMAAGMRTPPPPPLDEEAREPAPIPAPAPAPAPAPIPPPASTMDPETDAAVARYVAEMPSGPKLNPLVGTAPSTEPGHPMLPPLRRTEPEIPALRAPNAPTAPLAAPPSRPTALPAAPDFIDERQLSVLVVDDGEENRLLIRQFLRQTGHQLTFANDGLQAIEAFERGQFDAVLMDMQMPVMDGMAATAEIRRIEARRGAHPPVTIIALTAHAMPEQIERCLAVGCTSHLAKPIRRQTLIDALARVGTRQPAVPPPAPEAAPARTAAPVAPVEVDPRLVSLLPFFFESRQRDVQKLEEALTLGDLESARVIGHTMKGLGTSFGFPQVTEIGAQIEDAARAQRSEPIRRAIGALEAFLKQSAALARGKGRTP